MPGRDGVGDYLRRLAEACTRRGHVCAILALSDPFLTKPAESFLEREDICIQLICLPSTIPWKERLELARIFRDRFKPDWISFHVVPYAYHSRGILLGLNSLFRTLTAGHRLHLMFHELWVAGGSPAPWRDHVTGFVQRLGLRRMLALLQPRVVTTSNPMYAAMLRSVGGTPTLLPLCGNIPVEKITQPLSDYFERAEITATNRKEWWVGIFFGTLHRQWKPEPFLGLLLRAAAQAQKKICLVTVGRIGGAGAALWENLGKNYGSQITLINRGEQPSPLISGLLQAADFGIAATPWQLIGKSGTAAAMLEHGLPVIVTRDDLRPRLHPGRAPSEDPLLHLCNEELEIRLAAGLPRRTPRARADEIASQLCTQLHDATSPLT